MTLVVDYSVNGAPVGIMQPNSRLAGAPVGGMITIRRPMVYINLILSS